MKNKKLKISLILILIIILLSIPALSAPASHKRFICYACHTDVINEPGDGGECDDCHKFLSNNNIDVQKLETQHNPNICKSCHNAKDTEAFHALHGKVGSCTRCHGDKGNAVPDKTITECAGCHGGQIHAIHKDNLTQICSKCHRPTPKSNPASSSTSFTNELTAGIYAKVVNYKQFTLYEVFRRIFPSLSI